MVKVVHPDGDTQDIITAILHADGKPEHAGDTAVFARDFIGANPVQTLYNVWAFTRQKVKYVLDPPGEQIIKSPSVTWSTGFADCKGRTLFMSSIIKNLGIPYTYRFASYVPNKMLGHIYLLAKAGNDWYALDPDMPKFSMQKQPTFLKDYPMTKISYLSGVDNFDGKAQVEWNKARAKEREKERQERIKAAIKKHSDSRYKPGMLRLYNIGEGTNNMSEFDMEVAIRKQREEINKDILEKRMGIGCPHAEKIQNNLDVYDDIIEIRSNPELSHDEKIAHIGLIMKDHEDGLYNTSEEVAGIGDIGARLDKRMFKRFNLRERRFNIISGAIAEIEREDSEYQVGKTKFGKLLKKVSTGVKTAAKKVVNAAAKAGKALKNVVQDTLFLPVKGALEVTLPKIAPMFLYLFIKNKKLIDSLPEKARKKRRKAERVAKFIINTVGMKEDHFYGIVRNGIMKRFGMSPEAYLGKQLGVAISKVDVTSFSPFIAPAIELLKTIIGAFKKSSKDGEGDLLEDVKSAAPDFASDFAGWAEKERKDMGKKIQSQPKQDFEASPGEPSTQRAQTSDAGYYAGGNSGGDAGSDSTKGTNSRNTSKIC